MRRAVQIVLAVLVTAAFGPAQTQESSVVVDRDIRLFTVVAALNAAGFDIELGPRYHPVREEMREWLRGLDPDLSARLKAFYVLHRGEEPDEAQLAKYVSLALHLTDPPRMTLSTDSALMPQDAREVRGFVPLLNEFFGEARITQLWSIVGPAYDAELEQLAPRLRETIVSSDVYLRVPAGASGPRRLVVDLELAAPVNTVNLRNYFDGLYMVLGSSTADPTRDVRHAYLHLVLDAVVASNRELTKAETLLALLEGADGIVPEYVQQPRILVGESLIRAAEMRMDGIEGEDARERIDQLYRRGLLLVPFFYEGLVQFEETQVGIRSYFPSMMTSLSVEAETRRFEERFHSISLVAEERPRAEVPAGPDPVMETLASARDFFNAGDDEAARAAFLSVLESDAENGAALYGLALIASREQDVAEARELFLRATRSETIESSMRAWSHVYLGRIYDLECRRAEAVSHYTLALDSGAESEPALEAARSGLAGPFGDVCDEP